MSQYKLTYYNVEGLCEPIRYIFAIAGVDYEDCRIPKDSVNYPKLPPSIKDALPWGSMPVLDVDGKHRIAQSLAISRFLANRFNLTGADEFESAKCDELADSVMEFGMQCIKLLSTHLDEAQKLEAYKNLQKTTIPFYMERFNKVAKANGKWLVGKNLTWADLQVAHFLTLIVTRSKMPIVDGYPALQKLLDDVYAVPQIKEWRATRPGTT